MSTAARYHHGNLREALVDAGVDAVREQGSDGLALRDLARRVGVSHNAAYRHFADRDELVGEVAERGLAGLVAAMQTRLDAVPADADVVRRARRRLMEIGRGYVDFAIAEPGLFRVTFSAYPDLPASAEPVGQADPFGLLNAALDGLVAVGYLDPAARPGAEITCWSGVHGFAVLNLEGPLRALPAEVRDEALTQMLDALDRSYGATTGGHVPL